jgi:TnpA family transposase
MLPQVRITDLLLEVDRWTSFTQHFTHLKGDERAKDAPLLLTAILADAINLGLRKMSAACPGTSYARLSWLAAWYIRDKTYSKALAEVVNAQHRQPLASGDPGSGDGLHHPTASGFAQEVWSSKLAKSTFDTGPSLAVLFYTHVSDRFAPFHIKVINANVRDATHVLDGLLYHESDLRIEEHYTDTAGFTDHVFAMMSLLGFRFAPRIRDLADKRLYVPGKDQHWLG